MNRQTGSLCFRHPHADRTMDVNVRCDWQDLVQERAESHANKSEFKLGNVKKT